MHPIHRAIRVRGPEAYTVNLEYPPTTSKKSHTNDNQPVQDVREVNKRVTDIHPTIPNLYTLISKLPPDQQWYTVLDLKDAFFRFWLAP